MGVEEVPEKLELVEDGVTEMEEDKRDDEKEEAKEMEVDREEVKDCKEVEAKTDFKVSKNGNSGEEESDAGKGNQEAVEEKFKGDDKGEVEEDEEKLEEPKEEKGSKKQSGSKISAGKRDRSKKKKPAGKEQEHEQKTPSEKIIKEPKASVEEKRKEPKTPATPTIERPVRNRKSVERLVATIERDYGKEFQIEKGRGTALKDIPNVAYKLSRKKTNDTFKMLHTILFGRRAKAAQVKINISSFSGFSWKDDEEKQMIKLKEKLDKCVKEKLVEFCDVLDVPISRTHSRKEDIIATLIDFLLEPHATTSELLADQEQGTKRKRVSKSASGSGTPKSSSMGRKKSKNASSDGGETKGKNLESDAESNEEKDANGVPEKSDEDVPEQAENIGKQSESEVEPKVEGEKANKNRGSRKSSEKTKTKEPTSSKKINPPPKKTPIKTPPSRSQKKNNDSNEKAPSGKKEESIKKSSTSKKSASKESSGKKTPKVKDKRKEEALKPSDDELKNAVCEILKDVDFNTATFTDILKLLGKRFNMDMTPRKPSIKIMIQDELTRIANAGDEGDADKKL